MKDARKYIGFIREHLDIVEVIGECVPKLKPKRNGNNLACRCPFHHERTPSLTVNPEGQYFQCFGCGVSGNAIDFMAKFQGVSISKAIRLLAKKIGLDSATLVDPKNN